MSRQDIKKDGVKFGSGQSRDGNGRPKKITTVIRNLYLDEEGVKLTDGQIKDALRGYLSKTNEEIAVIMADKNVPYAFKMGWQLMKSQAAKGNSDVFKWLFEMQVGKAVSKNEHSGGTDKDGAPLPVTIFMLPDNGRG